MTLQVPHARERRQRGQGVGVIGPRGVAVAGLLMALLVLLAAAALVVGQRRESLRDVQSHSTLIASVLADHATRTIDTAGLALSALSEVVSSSDSEPDARLDWALAQSIAGLPVLRNLSVIDAQGLVLASTDAGSRGHVIDPKRLGVGLPPMGREVLGAYVAGRTLGSLVVGGDAPVAPPGVGFLPLVRQVQTRSGRPLLLVGQINPDAIANHHTQVLAEWQARALLLDLDGRVLAASASHPATPGDRAPGGAEVLGRSRALEHGVYVSADAERGPAEQIVAYRLSRTRPLLLVVETPVKSALADWTQEARSIGLGAFLVALVIGLLSQLAARSLMGRERAQLQRDRAQSVAALRDAEIGVLVKSVQELLFRADAQGRLSFVNARWHAASGQPEAQALGRELADLVRPDTAAAAKALFAPDGPAGLRTADVALGPDEHVRHFNVAVAPLLEGSRTVGYAGSAVDVTEQRTAQARLQAQLAFTELLLDVLPVPLSIRDAQGRYVSVNKAWQEFTGRPQAAVLGRVAGEGLTAAQLQEHARHDAEVMAHGGRTRYESSALHADGSVRDLAMTKAVVPGADGRANGILAAFMDVTEFREAERATRAARDAAEEASRAKTEFIANISHELRTPLQSIIGFSELGQTRSREQQRLGAMFGDIHAAGQRMLALVNDLLDVAKIESTVGTFHLERIDVRSLVRDVVGELSPQLGARQIVLELELSPAPLVAKVDPLRFQQVVRNVLANAIRFSPMGATLRVAGDIDHTQQIRISVHDQGPGIPPAELEHIFEAFVQSSKTKDGSGGTGLGLAISRKILQAHGGEISAENNAGGGATFHIVLPTRGFAVTLPQD